MEERLAQWEVAMPNAPLLIGKALKLDPDHARLDEVEYLIAKVPSLLVRLMRIANSALYSVHGSVAKPSQAIARVGIHGVRSLILAEGMQTLAVQGPLPHRLFCPRLLHEHSLGVMCAARRLLDTYQDIDLDPEEMATACLMHDLGRMVLPQIAPRECQLIGRLLSESKALLPIQAEAAVLGCTHETIGSSLAQRWKLPTVVCLALGQHGHQQLMKANPEEPAAFSLSGALVHVADCLAHQAGLGHRRGFYDHPDPAALTALGISAATESDFAPLREGLHREVALAGRRLGSA